MTDESGPSRRQFVRSLVATGGLGLLSGAGTRALMTDEESFTDNHFQGGQVDVTVLGEPVSGSLENVPRMEAFETPTPTPTASSGPGVQAASTDGTSGARVLSVGPLVSGRPQTLVLSLGVESCDPVDVWARIRPPDTQHVDVYTAAALVEMRVALAENAEFDDTQFSGTVRELVDDPLSSGEMLASGCSRASSACAPLFLGLEWTMPSGKTVEDSTTLEFVVDVVAQQCRTPTQNPWTTS